MCAKDSCGAFRRLSPGGEEDLALGLEPEGRKQAQSIMESVRSELGIPILASDSLAQAVTEGMELYDKLAAGRRVSLYIKVGGTEASLGRSPGILRLRSGFLPPRPRDLSPDRGIMVRFVERGVPVLTLLNIQDLAARWGMQ